jgi:hypothetical protein
MVLAISISILFLGVGSLLQPSRGYLLVNGGFIQFGSTNAHDLAGLEILRVEVEVPGWSMNENNVIRANTQGQTDPWI